MSELGAKNGLDDTSGSQVGHLFPVSLLKTSRLLHSV